MRTAILGGRASRSLKSATFGSPYKYNAGYSAKWVRGDTWYNCWADDDSIYTIACDFFGWSGGPPGDNGSGPGNTGSNWAISKLSDYTNSTTGSLVNQMAAWGHWAQAGSDAGNSSYKGCGIISINGVLYATVARQFYGNSSNSYIQSSQNAQIVKSTDHGVTWTPQPPATAQPYASPTFTGTRFASPSFVMYGKDYQGNTRHNSQNYVYAVSPDGVWNNGNSLILGRCLISAMPNLSGSDWSYYQGADGNTNAAWGAQSTAALIVSNTSKIGQAAVHYLPFLNRYVMFEWYYPNPSVTGSTVWDLYESPTPWGPWTKFQSNAWGSGQAFYNPTMIQKSVLIDGGRNIVLAFAGDYGSQDPATGAYTLTLLPVSFGT